MRKVNNCHTAESVIESIQDFIAILSARDDGKFNGFKNVARRYLAVEFIDQS